MPMEFGRSKKPQMDLAQTVDYLNGRAQLKLEPDKDKYWEGRKITPGKLGKGAKRGDVLGGNRMNGFLMRVHSNKASLTGQQKKDLKTHLTRMHSHYSRRASVNPQKKAEYQMLQYRIERTIQELEGTPVPASKMDRQVRQDTQVRPFSVLTERTYNPWAGSTLTIDGTAVKEAEKAIHGQIERDTLAARSSAGVVRADGSRVKLSDSVGRLDAKIENDARYKALQEDLNEIRDQQRVLDPPKTDADRSKHAELKDTYLSKKHELETLMRDIRIDTIVDEHYEEVLEGFDPQDDIQEWSSTLASCFRLPVEPSNADLAKALTKMMLYRSSQDFCNDLINTSGPDGERLKQAEGFQTDAKGKPIMGKDGPLPVEGQSRIHIDFRNLTVTGGMRVVGISQPGKSKLQSQFTVDLKATQSFRKPADLNSVEVRAEVVDRGKYSASKLQSMIAPLLPPAIDV